MLFCEDLEFFCRHVVGKNDCSAFDFYGSVPKVLLRRCRALWRRCKTLLRKNRAITGRKHIYIYIYICIYIHVCACVYVYIYVYIYLHICVNIYKYIYVYIYTFVVKCIQDTLVLLRNLLDFSSRALLLAQSLSLALSLSRYLSLLLSRSSTVFLPHSLIRKVEATKGEGVKGRGGRMGKKEEREM